MNVSDVLNPAWPKCLDPSYLKQIRKQKESEVSADYNKYMELLDVGKAAACMDSESVKESAGVFKIA